MTTCDRFDALHLASLDGPLPPSERAEFDGHLATCPACVDRLRGYVATVETLKGLARDEDLEDAPPLPEELVGRLLAARRESLREGRRTGRASG